MIKGAEPITSKDFNKGLVTRSDFLKGDLDASPNTMDVQWNFDASLRKRLGSTSTNAIALGSTAIAGWVLDTNTTLTTNLLAYWKMDEPGSNRNDQVGSLAFQPYDSGIATLSGIRGNAIEERGGGLERLFVVPNSTTIIGTSNFSVSLWFYPQTSNIVQVLLARRDQTPSDNFEYQISLSNNGLIQFAIGSSNVTGIQRVAATSFGTLSSNNWYNIVAWQSGNSHIGVSVNLSVNTALYTGGGSNTTANLLIAATDTQNLGSFTKGAIDEVGIWQKVLSAQERSDLYGGGSGNTYIGIGQTGFSWASFDFGASSIRWLTVSAGTGIYASSNRGTTFIVIGTTRTQNYQSLNRSKNVLIATSDSYDVPLYWAGSAGTFAATLAPNSAPSAKFSINYGGFLILLNSQDSNGTLNKRRFSYADENLQLTDPWTTQFDFDSSADDEITNAFVLYKFLYVSTRYRIFRVAFAGGSPDWISLKVKDWGYVPRTAQIVSLKGGGQVCIGLDWDRRIRMFDGFDDLFISDNVENDNGICDFATNKISYAGSGLQNCHAVLNPINQEYRLNVAIGSKSTQTTHAIILNARSLALYPYSNQFWQTMCIAESNNQRALMAFDRSGFCYILDSGNLDNQTAINEIYTTPPLFSQIPEIVSKGKQFNLFFAPVSCGIINYQTRVDLSNQWGQLLPLSNSKGETTITGTENLIKVLRTVDIRETYNTIQLQITSSGNTTNAANPWQMDRLDFFQQGFGIGKGV